MNYNDQIQTQQQYINYKQDQKQQQYDNMEQRNVQSKVNYIKLKNNNGNSHKQVFLRGKQNESDLNGNIKKNSIQGIETNHSFNGIFNQNRSQLKVSKKDTKNQIQFFDASNNKNFVKNKSFNSSGFSGVSQLSNYQFIDSSKNLNFNQNQMHQQTQKFIMKYFSDNFNANDFHRQYITLTDFIDILFQQYQNVIGNSNNDNIVEEFTNKIYLIFGQQIYFEDLFEKTLQNGLIGLILQAFKAIQQDETDKKNINFSSQMKYKLPINDSKYLKNPSNKNINNFNNINNQKLSRLTVESSLNSQQLKNPITKISLDKYFTNQNSKINIFDNSNNFNQQDLEDIKNLLSDYIQQMYQEAQKKVNQKYTQQYKKIYLKYKDTQKLLQKINQKISNHYDTLSTIKQYQKKVKIIKQKQQELLNIIKNMQSQSKNYKLQIQKEKQNNLKLNQQIEKLNKKIEKYQNAFFQKAMQKDNSLNSLSTSQISRNLNISTISAQHEKPKIEFKIDNYTEHRPIINPIVSPIASNICSYSPYIPKQSVYPTTPKQFKQTQRISVSPLKQRISFNNSQKNVVPSNPLNSNLQISSVKRVQIGDPFMLRPTSPIGKLQPLGGIQILNTRNNINNVFTTSRITTVSPIRR